eukprot:scaffold13889_cov178-Amphora_coffeaeformis.AAC.3
MEKRFSRRDQRSIGSSRFPCYLFPTILLHIIVDKFIQADKQMTVHITKKGNGSAADRPR